MGIMAMVLLTMATEVIVFMPSKTYGIRSLRDGGRRCREIYVVKDGETLQSISIRCDTPFILIDNPHIQDTDDVSAGLVLTLRSPQS
jgi:hypothetical protein